MLHERVLVETQTKAESKYRLDIERIRRFLPHRAPFLLVDRVLDIAPKGAHASIRDVTPENVVGTRVTAIKNFTYNEPFVPGHFPNYSIVPGVILIETMAQAASFSIYPFLESDLENATKNFQCILIGVDNVRFRKPVIPGDTFKIEIEVTRCRGLLWGFKATGIVDGKTVAEAELLANLITDKGTKS